MVTKKREIAQTEKKPKINTCDKKGRYSSKVGKPLKEAHNNTAKQYQVYATIIDQASKNLEKAEKHALNVYRQTIEKAAQTYREGMQLSLKEYQRTTDQALEVSIRETVPVRSGLSFQTLTIVYQVKDQVLNTGRLGINKLIHWCQFGWYFLKNKARVLISTHSKKRPERKNILNRKNRIPC